jgi:PAS domain S-box-containing protein
MSDTSRFSHSRLSKSTNYFNNCNNHTYSLLKLHGRIKNLNEWFNTYYNNNVMFTSHGDVRMFELKDKYKIPLIVILLAIAFSLTYYCHAVLRVGVLFTHFFYIPIILASLWWKRKGLIVAIFLAGMLILTDVFLNLSIYDDIVRGSMFIVIGSIVAVLSQTIAKRTNELKNSEEKYRTLYYSSSDAIMLLDEKGFFDCNDATLRIFGFSKREDFTKIHPSQVSPQYQPDGVDSGTAANNKIAEAFKKGTNRFEWVHQRQDGEYFSADVMLTAVNFKGKEIIQATVRDITERKRAQDKLRQQNEFIKLVINSFPHPFYVINIRDHTIALSNSMTPAYREGSTCYAVSHKRTSPCGSQEHICPLERVKITKKPTIVEHLHYDRNNNSRNMEVHCYPIFDHEGNMNQVIEYSVDITERKRSEELHIENIRLEQQNKAKSEFIAAMSHELRTPLNAIIGFSDVMIAGIGGNLNETHKGYVNDIYNSGQHLLLIINDILDLSKVEAGKMELVIETFSVNELLEEAFTLIKNVALKHHIDIIRNIDPQVELMDGDKQKIKQVLFNLLSNAVKFSKEDGGTITLVVKKIDGMVSFSVSDTGIGIENKNLDKLFKEFQQLDSGINRKYGGTGLGLSICKKFVEFLGGRISAESEIGKGSVFTFTLPLKRE